MSAYTVIKKLIGDINPLGEEDGGEENLRNLLQHIYTTEDMVFDLTMVASEVADSDLKTIVQAKSAETALRDLKHLIDRSLREIDKIKSESDER